jgi:hypothetical protein
MTVQSEFDAAVGWCSPTQIGYEVVGGDELAGNWTNWLDGELAAEEHRQGLEVGLSYEHCSFCRDEYVRRNCPHTETFTVQSLQDPRPHIYCSACGKHMPAPW